MAAALQVRGVCPKCRHVVDTTAPKGRATWRGPCPVKDCPGVVVARRVKAPPEPDQRPEQQEPAGDTKPPTRPRRKVVKVSEYATGAAGAHRAEPRGGADVQPAPEPSPRPDPARGGGGEPGKPELEPGGPEPKRERPARADRPERTSHPYSHVLGW